MTQTIVYIILQLLRGLPGGNDSVYTNVVLAEAIGDYVNAMGIVAFLEQNQDISRTVMKHYLTIRLSNICTMSFKSAEYFFLHWKILQDLWNEAELLHRKTASLPCDEQIREIKQLQDHCAVLGSDKLSIQYASEIVNHAIIA